MPNQGENLPIKVKERVGRKGDRGRPKMMEPTLTRSLPSKGEEKSRTR